MKENKLSNEGYIEWSQQKLFDIAANLTHKTYSGNYKGHKAHKPDFDIVIDRAKSYGV